MSRSRHQNDYDVIGDSQTALDYTTDEVHFIQVKIFRVYIVTTSK